MQHFVWLVSAAVVLVFFHYAIRVACVHVISTVILDHARFVDTDSDRIIALDNVKRGEQILNL